jgi:hypothetical protein
VCFTSFHQILFIGGVIRFRKVCKLEVGVILPFLSSRVWKKKFFKT